MLVARVVYVLGVQITGILVVPIVSSQRLLTAHRSNRGTVNIYLVFYTSSRLHEFLTIADSCMV